MVDSLSMACASCGAESGHFYDCALGGMKSLPPPSLGAPTSLAVDQLELPVDSARALRGRIVAVPFVLLLMLAFAQTGIGKMVLQVFFAMWLHELGHAVTQWMTGAFAVPLPWVTLGGEGRSAVVVLVEWGALAGWAFTLHRDGRRAQWWKPGVLAAVLAVGLLIPAHAREALVLFFGDGGALVFGALLMASVVLPDSWRVSRGGLRWGYLVIGAAAFASVATLWFSAWQDANEIPFGQIEGIARSDPSRLSEDHGWSERRLVVSYLGLAVTCLMAVGVTLKLSFPVALTKRAMPRS